MAEIHLLLQEEIPDDAAESDGTANNDRDARRGGNAFGKHEERSDLREAHEYARQDGPFYSFGSDLKGIAFPPAPQQEYRAQQHGDDLEDDGTDQAIDVAGGDLDEYVVQCVKRRGEKCEEYPVHGGGV